jgi:hypothetical protein
MSGPATVISGLITVISGTRSSSSSPSGRARSRRRTGGRSRAPAARPGHTLILAHGLEHVVDQLLDARRLDLADVDRPRPRTQHRWPMCATFRIDIAAL